MATGIGSANPVVENNVGVAVGEPEPKCSRRVLNRYKSYVIR